jgi:hypothetical protein
MAVFDEFGVLLFCDSFGGCGFAFLFCRRCAALQPEHGAIRSRRTRTQSDSQRGDQCRLVISPPLLAPSYALCFKMGHHNRAGNTHSSSSGLEGAGISRALESSNLRI